MGMRRPEHRFKCRGVKKLRRDVSGLSRKAAATLVVAIVVASSLGVLILLPPPAEEVRPAFFQTAQEEDLSVMENGDATIKRSFTVTTPALADVYRKAFTASENSASPPVTYTITHIIDDDFLTGTLENLTVENDEVKLSLEVGAYRPSGTLTSAGLLLAPLTSATATWNASTDPPLTTLTVWLSNDNGLTWESVDNGISHTFTSSGSVLRYKVEFRTESISMTPTLYDITLTFTCTTTHTTDDEFLTGTLENLTVENDEVKLSLEVGAYRPSGTLTSAELFFAPLTSATATWNASTPAGTTLAVELSNDNGTSWEGVENGDLHTFTSQDSVLRYRVLFYTEYPLATPTLYDITLTFTLQLPEENVMPPDQMFTEEAVNEYKTLLGLDATVTRFEKTLADPENRFLASLDVCVRGAAKYVPEDLIWKIDIGPKTGDDRAAAMGYMLTQMMFTQQMLENLGENVYEHTSSTPISLPLDAEILNWDELSDLRWCVDFGGGSYREASVTVDETLRKITLREKIVVTRQPLTVSPDEFLENLSGYRIFTIKYALGGGVGLGSGQPSSGGESLSLSDSGAKGGSSNWSKTWTRRIGYTFSKTFYWSGTYEGASASADAKISADLTLTTKLYIGWKASKWFKTYFEKNLSGYVEFEAQVDRGVSKSWSHTYDAYSHTFWFWIGYVPVWADLELEITPSVDLDADANGELWAQVNASLIGKFGVKWEKGEGWGPIKELSYNFWRGGPHITGYADIDIRPHVKLKLGFYLYSVAGPHAYLKPKVRLDASYPERTWSIEAGFDIGAGVGMGGLARWVGLSSWETELYSWFRLLGVGWWVWD